LVPFEPIPQIPAFPVLTESDTKDTKHEMACGSDIVYQISDAVQKKAQGKKPLSKEKSMPRNALRHLIQFELEKQAPLIFNKLL
jgi:hypothetical protein